MRTLIVRLTASLIVLSSVLFAACGDDDDGGPTTATGATATGTAAGGAATGGGSSTGTASVGGGGVGGSACDTWLVTYDLTGSVYQIDATISFTITVQEPYSENRNMGPGTMTLRFRDDAGTPGDGPVTIVDYSLNQNFVTGISLATVTTELMTTAGPDPCGVATGTLGGTTLTWSPTEAAPYCRDGQVSCTGAFCGSQGSPPENQPFVFDNDCTVPLPLNEFEFTDGVAAFTMAAVVMSQDGNATTTLAFVGTETSRELDPATPGCACN